MEEANKKLGSVFNGFAPVSSTPGPVLWKSRKRSVSLKIEDRVTDDVGKSPPKQEEVPKEEMEQESTPTTILSEKRKALFEPLEPVSINGRRPTAESVLPPPDFDEASYPRGWLIGKKRKLVNVDVVESMRRIAVQEMNRKDREIDGLNEQLEEDSRCLEHLQIQLLEERSKRADVERQNTMLQNQITMLVDMLQDHEDNENMDDGGEEP